MNSAPSTYCDQKQWYAVYTVVRHEKVVNSALNRKEIETFLPLRESINQWKDRRKTVRVPLFPGYLFVNTSDQERSAVITTSGVIRILGIREKPIAIPVEQILTIKTLLQSKVKYDPYPYIQEGTEV